MIPLAPAAIEALESMGGLRVGLVFPGRSRTWRTGDPEDPMKPLTSKRRVFQTTLERAGVNPEGIGMHSFRHTFISLLERIPGVSYSVVKALARHVSVGRDITARYLHPSDEELRWALKELEDRVLGPRQVVPIGQVASIG